MLNGSAGVDPAPAAPVARVAPAPAAKPIRVTLVGAQAGSQVVVRNGSGEVVWAGEIVLGEKRTVKARPPVKVKAQDAGALEARVNGKDQGSARRARPARHAARSTGPPPADPALVARRTTLDPARLA